MKFIRPRQVLEMIGVSRATLWRMVQAGDFPGPVQITERNRGYVLEAVEEWMRARAEGRPFELKSAGPSKTRGASRPSALAAASTERRAG